MMATSDGINQVVLLEEDRKWAVGGGSGRRWCEENSRLARVQPCKVHSSRGDLVTGDCQKEGGKMARM